MVYADFNLQMKHRWQLNQHYTLTLPCITGEWPILEQITPSLKHNICKFDFFLYPVLLFGAQVAFVAMSALSQLWPICQHQALLQNKDFLLLYMPRLPLILDYHNALYGKMPFNKYSEGSWLRIRQLWFMQLSCYSGQAMVAKPWHACHYWHTDTFQVTHSRACPPHWQPQQSLWQVPAACGLAGTPCSARQ